MAKSILVLIFHAPYGLEEAFAGLRLALAMAVNGLKATVVFAEDGVYNAMASQKAEVLKMPSNIDATKELYDFDVQVNVVKEDLEDRSIPESNVFEGLNVIPREELKKLVAEHDVVTTF